MDDRRRERLCGMILREIGQILENEISDPRLGFTTIQRIKLSKDGSNAVVFYSTMGSEEEKKAGSIAMKSSCGYIRHLLANRLETRIVPDLTMVQDNSIEKGEKVLNLMRNMEKD